jgi:tripartite-type tricarboxylate transporter receptor subunit TctC
MRKTALYMWAALLLLAPAAATAQDWPAKQPIRVIVPFSAGSATDIIARAVMEQVGTQLNQTIVIDNRVGAGGAIGAAAVAKAPPDGYTVLINSSSHAVLPSISANLSYDTMKDLPPLIPLANLPNVLVVNAAKGYKKVSELVAAAKAKSGGMNYASVGPGSAAHLNAERFRMAAGIEAQHIPFKGGPEALREIIADRVDFYFVPIPPALSLIKEGQLTALAVSGSTRASAFPDIPTTVEAGVPNSDYNFWIGMFVTTGTPGAITQRLYDETQKALATPTVKERLARLGAEPMPMTSAQFQAHVQKDIELNATLVKAAGLKPN